MIRGPFVLVLPLALVACGQPDPAPEPESTTSSATNPAIERFDDTKVVVVADGLGAHGSEMLRFGEEKGAKAETLTGLCGLGDLVLTCSSTSSRNFSLGKALGE